MQPHDRDLTEAMLRANAAQQIHSAKIAELSALVTLGSPADVIEEARQAVMSATEAVLDALIEHGYQIRRNVGLSRNG